MALLLYGIPHCDTVKKARAWLDGQSVGYVFHDFRKQGVPEDHLDAWLREVGWEKLLNRRGTLWRRLDAETQAGVRDAAAARALMLQQPGVIKRPVVEWGRTTTVGFDPSVWSGQLDR